MTRVGFVGLGRMGRPMASNLQRKGFALTVLDINPQPIADLVALGARKADDLADLVRSSDIIVTMLPTSVEVLATVTGAGGVIDHAREGQIILDMSTIEPEATDAMAKAARAKGVSVVDAPVGRLATHADRGESLFMVGAAAADLESVRPLLDAMGTTILHCGEVGAGVRMKLVNNYICVVSCQMNAEALALSQRFGLDLDRTLEVLNGTTAYNGQLQLNWPNKVLIGDNSAGFTIDLAHKDLSLAMTAANAARVPMPLGAAAREAFSIARAGDYAQCDFSAIGDAHCELARVEKPRIKPKQG
jgi:4-hydroxybutyrate dehydrogenase/sulfolactaldehyde 3-reductase